VIDIAYEFRSSELTGLKWLCDCTADNDYYIGSSLFYRVDARHCVSSIAYNGRKFGENAISWRSGHSAGCYLFNECFIAQLCSSGD